MRGGRFTCTSESLACRCATGLSGAPLDVDVDVDNDDCAPPAALGVAVVAAVPPVRRAAGRLAI